MGLVQAIEQIPLSQKTVEHSPIGEWHTCALQLRTETEPELIACNAGSGNV
jgi:hypothetical protein